MTSRIDPKTPNDIAVDALLTNLSKVNIQLGTNNSTSSHRIPISSAVLPTEVILLITEFTPIYLLAKLRVHRSMSCIIDAKYAELRQYWAERYNHLLATGSTTHIGLIPDSISVTRKYKTWLVLTKVETSTISPSELVSKLQRIPIDQVINHMNLTPPELQFVEDISKQFGASPGAIVSGAKYDQYVLQVHWGSSALRAIHRMVVIDLRSLRIFDSILVLNSSEFFGVLV